MTKSVRTHCVLTGALAVLALAAAPCAAATYTIAPEGNRLEVFTAKAGLFKAAGHAHVVRAMVFGGEIEADPARPQGARLKLLIQAGSLKVMDPGLPEKDRATVQKNMEGDATLDVNRFATITFDSKAVSAEPDGKGGYRVTLDGTLGLHGVENAVKVPADVTIKGDDLTAKGEVQIRQKDFGITPFKAALGTIGVKNEVRIEFEIVAHKKK